MGLASPIVGEATGTLFTGICGYNGEGFEKAGERERYGLIFVPFGCTSEPSPDWSYPQETSVIHRKRGVIHRPGRVEGMSDRIYPPNMVVRGSKRPGMGGVDIVREGVENLERSTAVVVESLPQSDDLAADIFVLFDQVRDALTAVENSGVVSPPQHSPNLR